MNTSTATKKKNNKPQEYRTTTECVRGAYYLWENGWEGDPRDCFSRFGSHTIELKVDSEDVRKVRAIVRRESQEGSEEIANFADYSGDRAAHLAVKAMHPNWPTTRPTIC
jgi:hypothetical protein